MLNQCLWHLPKVMFCQVELNIYLICAVKGESRYKVRVRRYVMSQKDRGSAEISCSKQVLQELLFRNHKLHMCDGLQLMITFTFNSCELFFF